MYQEIKLLASYYGIVLENPAKISLLNKHLIIKKNIFKKQAFICKFICICKFVEVHLK